MMEARRSRGEQSQLNRPVTQLGLRRWVLGVAARFGLGTGGPRPTKELVEPARRAAAVSVVDRFVGSGLGIHSSVGAPRAITAGRRPRQVLLDRSLVERRSVPSLDRYGPLRTVPQARPQTITKDVRRQLRLPVDDPDGSLRTGGNALSAAVAQVLVDRNKLSDQFAAQLSVNVRLPTAGNSAILDDRIG